MKSFKTYLLVAVLSLTTVFVPAAFASGVRPVRGIDVIVECTQCNPPKIGAKMTAAPNKDGNLIIKLPGPGKFTISYADGPKKNQVIKTVTVSKAGPVSLPKSAAQ